MKLIIIDDEGKRYELEVDLEFLKIINNMLILSCDHLNLVARSAEVTPLEKKSFNKLRTKYVHKILEFLKSFFDEH